MTAVALLLTGIRTAFKFPGKPLATEALVQRITRAKRLRNI